MLNRMIIIRAAARGNDRSLARAAFSASFEAPSAAPNRVESLFWTFPGTYAVPMLLPERRMRAVASRRGQETSTSQRWQSRCFQRSPAVRCATTTQLRSLGEVRGDRLQDDLNWAGEVASNRSAQHRSFPFTDTKKP